LSGYPGSPPAGKRLFYEKVVFFCDTDQLGTVFQQPERLDFDLLAGA
jgi:hypothetical protein